MRRILPLSFLGLGILILAAVPASALKVVDDNATCSGWTDTDLQTAIDDASPGEVVEVCPGEYSTSVGFVIDKELTLQARFPASQANPLDSAVLVNGSPGVPPGDSYVLRVSSSDVVVDGLWIRSLAMAAGVDAQGILVRADDGGHLSNISLRDNIIEWPCFAELAITDTCTAIRWEEASGDVTLNQVLKASPSLAGGPGYGMWFTASPNGTVPSLTVQDNSLQGFKTTGILLEGYEQAQIVGNDLGLTAGEGGQRSMELRDASGALVQGNGMRGYIGGGLLVTRSAGASSDPSGLTIEDNEIDNSAFIDGGFALELDPADTTLVQGNHFKGLLFYNTPDGNYGVLIGDGDGSQSSDGNTICGNLYEGSTWGPTEDVASEIIHEAGTGNSFPGGGDIVANGECVPPIIDIGIDVRPGSSTNQINTNARQLVPVLVLGTADFDPCQVLDEDTIELHGGPPSLTRRECYDYEGDGDFDLELFFRARGMEPPSPDECDDPAPTVTLHALGNDGMTQYVGEDSVEWLGPDCK